MTTTYQGVTLDELRSELRYVPSSGKLYWRKPAKGRVAGKPVGTYSKAIGYLLINWKQGSASLLVHRVAFWMHNGYLPEQVDHANRNKRDNRAENLRAATHSQNKQNTLTHSGNTTGYRWVMVQPNGRYRWAMMVDGVMSRKSGYLTAAAAYADACAMHRTLAKEFSPV